ncbi:hypothetical protein KSP39_PZI007836 [Platanthera zijinensis]|uniref:Uncharacterized protein n=1 Tax=Platanthera zijinensis TaxID=2320716 RepID=A0AAP0BP84_9ASPA
MGSLCTQTNFKLQLNPTSTHHKHTQRDRPVRPSTRAVSNPANSPLAGETKHTPGGTGSPARWPTRRREVTGRDPTAPNRELLLARQVQYRGRERMSENERLKCFPKCFMKRKEIHHYTLHRLDQPHTDVH